MNDKEKSKRISYARLRALMNANYHEERRRFLEGVNRSLTFIIVFLGASSVVNHFSEINYLKEAVGVLITTISASQLVFDYGRRSRDHQFLQRDYYHLLSEIESTAKPSLQKSAEWNGKLVNLSSTEPPAKFAVLAISQNKAMLSIQNDPGDEILHIPRLHRFLRNFYSFPSHQYKTIGEMKKKGKPFS